MKKLAIILLVLAIGLPATAYPKPSLAQRPGKWTVKGEITHPAQILVNIPGKGPQRFWYTILTVTNPMDEEVSFYPKCELMADTFQIIPAGKNTPGFVFDKLERLYQGQYPFLESLENVDGRILAGSDNTRDIAIIWPDFDDNAKNFKIFISGLSNEIKSVKMPTKKGETAKTDVIYLRKTLEVDYRIAGDSKRRSETPVKFLEKKWVMR